MLSYKIGGDTEVYKMCIRDSLLTPDDMFVLDGVCMKLIFIGESVKTIDKLSEGELFPLYPVIPWKEIMKLRDVILIIILK